MPKLKIRFVNVVDLMKMEDSSEHPHGLSNEEFDKLFTTDRPVIFNFHGYPKLIHEFLVKRTNKNFDVHGYREEGSITTAFDMRVQNEIDRFSLVKAVVKALGKDESEKALVNEMNALLEKHKKYIAKYGVDMPEVANFKWNGK